MQSEDNMTKQFSDMLVNVIWLGVAVVVVYFAYAVNLISAVVSIVRNLGL